ncbi:deoxynucleoside kinase [Mycoplasmopsis columbinasalis]|uniref:Deoxyguanosine kinase n=1 Tax=Mycoplasmopsis columbinasalis TaxID=114880 RepID=A0A449BA95_9BACT|nr:deoxynucleoside kinase [Mycoplasmopsis columbinasalis]VEU78086.1 Deoxyguanosine kinase [Mycoplasmopsis columbinasalis]
MVIAISGMIGAGKSTLATALHKYYRNSMMMVEFEEDDDVFNIFLKWLYEKQPNIDIGFQAYIIESLSAKFQKTIADFKAQGYQFDKNHIFLDRFNLEHYIFAAANLSEKNLKYLKGFDAMFHQIVSPSENPDFAIFLDISFETFKERVFKRNRASEVENFDQNLRYFMRLHDFYKEMFIALCNKYKIPYHIINCNNKTQEQIFAEALILVETFDFSQLQRR